VLPDWQPPKTMNAAIKAWRGTLAFGWQLSGKS